MTDFTIRWSARFTALALVNVALYWFWVLIGQRGY
jgi:hypothetical protein